MILSDFHTTFVKMHELRASVHIWIMMFFGSAQRSCEHETHKCRFITSIREYPPYWKFRLAYFPLRIYATTNFKWIISFVNIYSSRFSHPTENAEQIVHESKDFLLLSRGSDLKTKTNSICWQIKIAAKYFPTKLLHSANSWNIQWVFNINLKNTPHSCPPKQAGIYNAIFLDVLIQILR